MSKLKKLTAIFLSAVMLVCCFAVSAGAEQTVRVLKSGKSNTVEILSGKYETYKFTTFDDGDFVLDISAGAAWSGITVINEDNGDSIVPDFKNEEGNAWFFEDKNESRLFWDPDVNKKVHQYKGTLTYHLVGGSYKMIIKQLTAKEMLPKDEYNEWQKNGGKDDFVAKYIFTAKYNTGLDGFQITLKKGASLQLGALIGGEAADGVKWSSSQKKVAAVNSKGKITAKKAGTAVITAKLEDSEINITVKVTK